MDNENLFLFCVLLGVVLTGLVAILGGFLHYRRERLLTHTERMKALELGLAMPDDAQTARMKAIYGTSTSSEDTESGSLAPQCFKTALWVAFWGFLAAAGPGNTGVNPGVSYAIAASAGSIGVTAMICGTILATRARAAAPRSLASCKPTTEADAIDVVSSRG